MYPAEFFFYHHETTRITLTESLDFFTAAILGNLLPPATPSPFIQQEEALQLYLQSSLTLEKTPSYSRQTAAYVFVAHFIQHSLYSETLQEFPYTTSDTKLARRTICDPCCRSVFANKKSVLSSVSRCPCLNCFLDQTFL